MSPCCTLWEGVYQSWVYPNTWQECGEIDTLVDVTTIAQEAGPLLCGGNGGLDGRHRDNPITLLS